jgi:hypothetical protein
LWKLPLLPLDSSEVCGKDISPTGALIFATVLAFAALAQLDRASAYGAEGCRFDSCRLHLLLSPCSYQMFGNNKPISAQRIWLARSIAMAVDLVQIGLFPYFMEGALSPANFVLDVIMAALMIMLVGWHIAFLPSAMVELLPVVDLAPTWTIAAFIATRGRKSENAK